jgi:hypothetical protein
MGILEKIRAPFTAVQVQGLNEYQTGTDFGHKMPPFTCGNRGDGQHGEEGGDKGVLIATEQGWVCPCCEYTQDWAHSFMVSSRTSHMPHFFERVLSTEEKIALVEGLQADYVELRSRRPGAAGISEMLDTLQQRITELKAEL